MRRPLLAMCFCMSLGVVIARFTELSWWQLSMVICCFSFSVFLRQKLVERSISRMGKQRTRTIAFICVLFFVVGFLRMEGERADNGLLEQWDGQVVSLEGRVVSAKINDGYSAVIVKVKQGDVWQLSGVKRILTGTEKVLVRLSTEEVEYVYSLPGRDCSFQGEISLPNGRRNPGCLDYASYLKARGINVLCTVSQFRFNGGNVRRPVLNWLATIKGCFFSAARNIMPGEDFGVLAGLLFGERSFMDEESYEEFQANGIAHVLAVSGLHVGLVYEMIVRLLGGRRNWKTTILMLISLFAYAALADFSVSVMRAALMIAIRLLSVHLERRYDLVSAASLSAVIFMTINPYQLFDSGFQLSFIAAYTMGICMPWSAIKVQALADKYKKEWIEKLGSLVLPALLIQLGMVPMTVYHFCLFSPIALLLNPLAIFLAGLILAAGLAFFGIFIMLGEGLLFAGAAGPAQWLCRALSLLNNAGTNTSGGFAVPALPLTTVVVYYLLFFFFFSETRYVLCRRKMNSLTLTIALGLAAAGCIFPYLTGLSSSPLPWKYKDYTVVFLDVGQGDSIHISIDGKNILVDGGGQYGRDVAKSILKPYLLKNGVGKLDLAIVTHSDGDHSRGIQQLSQQMEIDCIAFPECYRGDEERLEPYITENRIFLGAGDEIRISVDACLKIIAPAKEADVSENENDNSTVMVLEYKGLKILLTGDMEGEGEAVLLAQNHLYQEELLDCDILKVAHHGSENSTSKAFVDAVSPDFAVISCGVSNSYGHPHKRVVDLLEKSDIIYGRTDSCGAVCLRNFSENEIILENAAKDKEWHIQRETNQRESIPQRP